MPEITQNPGFTIPAPPPNVSYLPDTGMPKLDEVNDWKNKAVTRDLGLENDYAQSISSGDSISDLILDVQNIQAKGQALLDNDKDYVSSNPGGFNPDAAFQDLSRKINPQTPTLRAAGQPLPIGSVSDFNRYKESENFQTFGYTPQMGSGQEYKYGNAMSWGDTIGNALAGGSHLAYDTFVEGWKGWGRMTEALFSWDSSKLMGSEEERYEIAQRQEELFNKYAIYDTAESKDSLFNRQFFGTMLQQSGFAVGAIAQFALEAWATAGIGTFIKAGAAPLFIARVARTAEELAALRLAGNIAQKTSIIGRTGEGIKNLFRPKLIQTTGELINTNRQAANVITKLERVTNAIKNGVKILTPGYGTIEEMIKLNKAGAGFAQLAYTGLGGIKRGLSEFNMARSESIFEAASTYKQLKDRLTDSFKSENGREPTPEELEKINQSAENASHDNFWTNVGVLSVMNRIQFDNMFKQFGKSRTLLGDEMALLRGKAFQVTGKVAGKNESRVYAKGLLGRLGAVPQIAKTFGKKTAAWEAAKGIPGLMKFEFSEGMQELIQSASSKGLEDYYTDLYHGKRGYATKLDKVVGSMQNPFTNMEGMKTFLMGALTGRLIAPMTFGFTKISESVKDKRSIQKATVAYKELVETQVKAHTEKFGEAPSAEQFIKIQEFSKKSTEYKTLKQNVIESVESLNALYKNPTWIKNEAIANIKVNDLAAETMDIAAANHDRYLFNNTKDSALAKAVASAIKLNLYDSLKSMLEEYGAEMSDEEFGQAFGMDPNKENKGNAKKLTDNVVKQIEDYYNTFKNLKDKYGDRIIPELYKNNKPQDYANAQEQKAVLDDVIEMLATNQYKAKQAIVRAVGLQTEMGQNKAIGSSSIEVLTILGSDQGLLDHTKQLTRQLKMMAASPVALTTEQKEQYKDIEAELNHIMDWYDNRDELINEAKVDKSYTAYTALINLFNKRANNRTNVSKEDFEDSFLKFIDYIKLNKDNKQFIDAMNLLSDPKNMKLVAIANRNALYAWVEKAQEEQRREIEKATGVDIPRHSVIKDEDETFSVKSYDGIVIEKGIVTEEEAIAKAEELDAKFKEALEKEERESKEKEKESTDTSDTKTKKADWIGNLSNIKDELNKLKNKEEKLKWLADNDYLDLFTQDGKTSLYLKTATGRVVVKIKIGEITIPFYISTGSGEKTDVETNKWYVFFGQGKDGWFNKTSGKDINEQYGVKVFQDIASILNDVGSNKDEYKNHEDEKGFMDLKWTGAAENQLQTVIDFITPVQPNPGPNGPTATPEQIAQLKQNIQTVKDRVAAELDALEGTSTKISAKNLITKIGESKNQVELDKVMEEDLDDFTDAEMTEIEKAIDDKKNELDEIALRASTTKTITDTDPEFVKPYYEALDKIEKTVNTPGVTWVEANKAFDLLRPILAKLEPVIKKEYNKKHNAEKTAVKQRIKAEEESKDIEGAKTLITDSLASDDTPLNTSFQVLYQQLNLKLNPEFKEEAIQHFEKEYIKAIDRKINSLIAKVNLSTSSEALTSLILASNTFRGKIEKSLAALKAKSQKLKDISSGNGGLAVDSDPTFDNPVHRSIIRRKDGKASYGQKAAIENLINSGILTQTDIDGVDENSKHGASELVNLGVARISTIQINKALAQHFRNEPNTLKQLITKYLSDTRLGIEFESEDGSKYKYTKEDLNDDVDVLIDKDINDSIEKVLDSLDIPKTREISKEEYIAITGYRAAIGSIIKETAVVDTLDNFIAHQQSLVTTGDEVSDEEIIPISLAEEFKDEFLKKDADGKINVQSFYTDLIATFKKLKEVATPAEATKLIKVIFSKHLIIGSDGLEVLKTLYSTALQTDNLLKSESDNSEPLSEEEMVKVLDAPENIQSLNKEQIGQIEKYAKEEKLLEYKKRLQAAIGYNDTSALYTPEKNIVVTKTGEPFSSLRPKFATDKRTTEDLAIYFMPDENGMIQTKLALTYIIYSEFATAAEKTLAKKLLEIVSDDDMIKVDNNIKASGEFDSETNEIFLNLEAVGYKANRPSAPVETVILHELIHAMIEKAIADPTSEYYKAIKNVFNAIKNVEGANTFYAFQSTLNPDEQLREFVTEAFTNPAFQYLLAKTPYANTTNSLYTFETLWDRFIDAISNLLSLMGIDIINTALSEVLSLTDQLINKKAISEGDKFPSEKVMEEIKNANSKEDIDKIRENLDVNKNEYTDDMYNALDAALKGKMKSINARDMSDATKGMEAMKIGKTTVYVSGDSKGFKVFKKGRNKISEVKDVSILRAVKDILDKRNPTSDVDDVLTSTNQVQITSDLKDKVFVEDPSTLDFSTVFPGETITAAETNGLRSKGNDVDTKTYKENESFVKYYSKIRNIINKLSKATAAEIGGFYVTLDKDSAGIRWDGSAEDSGWKSADKGVMGYISDEDGNPIVFNKQGKAIGRADKNDPASSKYNTGENQIVYFATFTENTHPYSLSKIDKEDLTKIFAARKAAMEGRPQIAKLQKVSMGQMVLKGLVKPQSKSQKNTARDKDINEQMNQDHVFLKLIGQFLNAFIEDADGGFNKTALFTPSTRAVKVTGPDGNTVGLFDHLVELMRTYQQMLEDGNPNVGTIQRDLVMFAQNMWYSSSNGSASIQMPQNLKSISLRDTNKNGVRTEVRLTLFDIKNGVVTFNEANVNRVRNHMNDMKVNVAKIWLEGKEKFKFPYISQENGKKTINFEEKNYKDFLMNDVGLITYISNIPIKENIRRYNSSIHFLELSDLNPKAPTIIVTQANVVNNSNASKIAVDAAVKNAKVPEGKDIKDPSKGKKFGAPSYQETYKETYEKICK